jgi:WD40 repeat protein
MNLSTAGPGRPFLLSTSNDGTFKIWDLRKGHILYTLYGHEGPSTAGSFSPAGEYFCTGGKDSAVLVWKSNLVHGGLVSEDIPGLATKNKTEVYVTDKEVVNKLPDEDGQQKENNSKV